MKRVYNTRSNANKTAREDNTSGVRSSKRRTSIQDHETTSTMTDEDKSSAELVHTRKLESKQNKSCDNDARIQNKKGPVYSELYTKEYAKDYGKCFDLNYHPKSVCEINNSIWCGGENIINVYSKNGELLSIFKDEVKGVFDIAKTSEEEVIIACENGLHQLELTSNLQPGKYKSLVVLGSFSGVTIVGENLYALEYKKHRILVFKQRNDKWEHYNCIHIHQSNMHHFNRLFIHEGLIYVSLWNDQCIHVYTLEGELHHQFVNQSNHGILCGVDKTGSLLVADFCVSELKVYDTEQSWRVIKFFGKTRQWPIDVVVDMDGNVWMADNNRKLIKYKKIYGWKCLDNNRKLIKYKKI